MSSISTSRGKYTNVFDGKLTVVLSHNCFHLASLVLFHVDWRYCRTPTLVYVGLIFEEVFNILPVVRFSCGMVCIGTSSFICLGIFQVSMSEEPQISDLLQKGLYMQVVAKHRNISIV